ncbi:MAG: hypothetical protein JKY80_00805 [Mariprofundaceae bacterium]|nr:hypothetical protein [Mariprofundaceae bacterium]
MSQYRCKHFNIKELVPKHVYEARGDKAWELFDDRALRMIDALRDHFGVVTVNNWHVGGERNWSGLRTEDSPYYSAYSQHTFGRAFDCLFTSVASEKVREEILAKPKADFAYLITGIELATSWLHVDVRNTNRIKTFTA